MTTTFNLLDNHLVSPRPFTPAGRVVLSRLNPGSCAIAAQSPSVKFVLEGEEIYSVDGVDYRVRPGEFLYLEPGRICTARNGEHTIGLCVMLPGEAIEPSESPPILGRALVLSSRTSVAGRALSTYARRLARSPGLGAALAPEIVSGVDTIVTGAVADSQAALANLRTARPSTRRDIFQRLDRVRGYLHDRPDRAVTLAELASIACLSQFHLARYFKSAFGTAPIAYHRALRLERAATLLLGGAPSLAAVAAATGYSDDVALSHAFRKHYGMAPQQWAAQASQRGQDLVRFPPAA